jgi:hypothetical protein
MFFFVLLKGKHFQWRLKEILNVFIFLENVVRLAFYFKFIPLTCARFEFEIPFLTRHQKFDMWHKA